MTISTPAVGSGAGADGRLQVRLTQVRLQPIARHIAHAGVVDIIHLARIGSRQDRSRNHPPSGADYSNVARRVEARVISIRHVTRCNEPIIDRCDSRIRGRRSDQR